MVPVSQSSGYLRLFALSRKPRPADHYQPLKLLAILVCPDAEWGWELYRFL